MDQWYPGSEPINNAAARGHVSQPRIQTENWDSFSPQGDHAQISLLEKAMKN